MRRVVFGVLASLVLMVGSVGAVAAAPAESANCIGEAAVAFAPGTLGPVISAQVKGVGAGGVIGPDASSNDCADLG